YSPHASPPAPHSFPTRRSSDLLDLETSFQPRLLRSGRHRHPVPPIDGRPKPSEPSRQLSGFAVRTSSMAARCFSLVASSRNEASIEFPASSPTRVIPHPNTSAQPRKLSSM